MPHCLICTLASQHLPCSSRRRRQRSGGIASWVASTAVLPFPRGHTRIELGQQRCAARKKSKPNRIEIELLIEKSNRNRSKSIKPNRNITSFYTCCFYSAYCCIYIVVHCSVAEAVPVYDQSHPQPTASVPVVPVHFSMTHTGYSWMMVYSVTVRFRVSVRVNVRVMDSRYRWSRRWGSSV